MLRLAIAILAVDPMLAAQRAHDAEAVERVAEVYAAIDAATDNEEWRAELRRLCKRESWCNRFARVELHACDAYRGRGRKFWRRSVERGRLRPDECSEHEIGDPVRWSTWGVFGQAGTGVWLLEGCYAPEEMADPFVAAPVAVATFEFLCEERDLCECEDRDRIWTGPGIWDHRRSTRNMASLTSFCGPQPRWRWAWAAAYDVSAWPMLTLARTVRALAQRSGS